jgi:TatA/E family protein of Tat protein translocase
MNILGMGPMEILLIVVLALIVFGPAKLPEIMGQVGRAIADFRRATSSLSDEFNRTIQAELAETRGVIDETKSAVTGVHTTINAALSSTAAAAAAPTLTAPAPAPVAGGSNGTNGVHTPPETPPLADNAQWSWETAAPVQSEPGVAGASPSAPVVIAEPVEHVAELPTAPRRPTRSDDLLPPY